jgi:Zn-dependent M28 family amino/carboxypeptidase
MADPIQQLLDTISKDRIQKQIQSLEGVRHPVAAPAGLEKARRHIQEVLAGLRYDITEHSFDDDAGTFTNVIATRKGTFQPERRLLVVAHFDTVFASPGADDNASGVAVLLELARVLEPYRFERTVQFVAANLEEYPREDYTGQALRGSTALARHAREEGWEIDGVVVLESVAYAGASAIQSAPEGIPLDIPEKGDFIAVVGNDSSDALVQEFCRGIERCGIKLPYLCLEVPGHGEMLPDTRRSDHAPFWDNGFKAIMLTDTAQFRNPNYHQPSDTLETLNLEFAAEVCRATAVLIANLAGWIAA